LSQQNLFYMRQVLKWAAVPVIAATVLLACNKGKPTSTTPIASDALKGSCSFDNCKHGTNKKRRSGPLNFYGLESATAIGNGFHSGTTNSYSQAPTTNPVIGSAGDNIIRDIATKKPLNVKGIATIFDPASMNNSSEMLALVIDANQNYVIYTFSNSDPNLATFVASINNAGAKLNTSNARLVDIEYDYNNHTINSGTSGSPFLNTEFRIIALDQLNGRVISIDCNTGSVLMSTAFTLGGIPLPLPGNPNGTYNDNAMIGSPVSLGWQDCGTIFSMPFIPVLEHGHVYVLSIQQSSIGGQLYLSKISGNDHTQLNGPGHHFGWCCSVDKILSKISPYDVTAADYGIMFDHYGAAGFIFGNNRRQFGQNNTSCGGPFYSWALFNTSEYAVNDVTPFIDFAPGSFE
jgi:hypothetical protein